MHDQDVSPGHLDRCQVCGSSNLRLLIDLGHQAPCAALLTFAQLDEPETTYPLRLMQCANCTLAQLVSVVPAEVVYPNDYPYLAGISWPVVAAHKKMASDLVSRFGKGFVVDVGCNDGTLLAQFQQQGCKVLGIEPTGVAYVALRSGVPTLHDFFGEKVARSIGEPADLVTFTNVFAHMANLGDVMRGVDALLADRGVLVIENHYLLDILERNQFDTVYHEHIRTYSLRSLVTLFAQYGFEVFDVERVPRYGGNIRVYVSRAGARAPEASVRALLAHEASSGIDEPDAWEAFRARVFNARERFMRFAADNVVHGCSAPGRASTLLN